jgi:hypothetical protein
MKRAAVYLCGLAVLATSQAVFADKPSLGVAEFTNTATGVYWWGGGVGWELSSMLSNELSNTHKFRVVERNKLEPVLREQNLAASGRVSHGTAAKIGNLTGSRAPYPRSKATRPTREAGSASAASPSAVARATPTWRSTCG